MKAIQYRTFGGPEVLEYVELPEPEPGPGDVLIETSAIGVNFPDIRERLGVYNRAETRVGGVTLPQVGGLQLVGRVLRSGPGADKALEGRKVMALMPKGAYAQQAVAQAGMVVALDEHADDIAMASLPCQGVTAFLALQACTTLRQGESVLVQGAAGGVGSLAVQIAKALGAGTVIGTASSEARRAFVRSIGADHAIAYDAPDWPQMVLDHTGGRGADIILETIGGQVFDQNFECLAMLGRCVVIGSTRGPGQPLAPRRLMAKAQSLAGVYMPSFFQRPELIQRALRFLANGVANGSIKPTVGAVLPLSRTADAHGLLERRKVQGVVVLDPQA
ncbi:zinc-binding dehydrogenase [Bradyrhizobium sp. LA7.1]|uniref:quinone oxidoreductase family protein n=1 Tax=Bradyrhizobium sp. LA7.1 TaxID=3156324 RepID=UPI0033920A6B